MTAIQPLFTDLEPMPNASADAPIGIFDSGIGGTSIWFAIHNLLPNEDTIYLADSKNAPYGQKSQEEIKFLNIERALYSLRKTLSSLR